VATACAHSFSDALTTETADTAATAAATATATAAATAAEPVVATVPVVIPESPPPAKRISTPIMPNSDAEEEEDDEIEARIITYTDGVQYLLSDDNSIYNSDTFEMIGTFDPETKIITFH